PKSGAPSSPHGSSMASLSNHIQHSRSDGQHLLRHYPSSTTSHGNQNRDPTSTTSRRHQSNISSLNPPRSNGSNKVDRATSPAFQIGDPDLAPLLTSSTSGYKSVHEEQIWHLLKIWAAIAVQTGGHRQQQHLWLSLLQATDTTPANRIASDRQPKWAGHEQGKQRPPSSYSHGQRSSSISSGVSIITTHIQQAAISIEGSPDPGQRSESDQHRPWISHRGQRPS
ncbi:hypothetical protein ACLOJK_004777, partial [Asimina triloba]